jgi:superfamily II DNA/RNA helicase
LHGNKSQRAREDVLTAFRRGHVQTLLATNVAARGLDIHGIYQVINYELPESSELFTHRVGRTGRMGRQGKAITLLVPSELPKWRRMARNLGQTVALQRLVLDEVAAAPSPLIQPEPLVDEQEKQRDQVAQYNRNSVPSERARRASLDEARQMPADAQKAQKERRVVQASARSGRPESPTMRPRPSSKAQGRQASSGRTSGRLKTGTLREMPPLRAVRRKINSSPAARTYASKRSGRR